jgi:hypothetical protein
MEAKPEVLAKFESEAPTPCSRPFTSVRYSRNFAVVARIHQHQVAELLLIASFLWLVEVGSVEITAAPPRPE